jgi:outer membrane biosynthesis protein TonB
MRRRNLRPILALPAALLALAAAGCGEEDPRLLTEGRSDALLDLLDDAEKQFEDGECDELGNTLDEFADQVNEVQGEVDENVRTALREESADLVELQDECEPPEPPVVTETVPPPTTIETAPPPITEETEPPTTEEETTEEEPPPEEPPPEEPPGNGPNGEGPGQEPPEADSDGSSGPGGSSGSGGRGGGGE